MCLLAVHLHLFPDGKKEKFQIKKYSVLANMRCIENNISVLKKKNICFSSAEQ